MGGLVEGLLGRGLGQGQLRAQGMLQGAWAQAVLAPGTLGQGRWSLGRGEKETGRCYWGGAPSKAPPPPLPQGMGFPREGL